MLARLSDAWAWLESHGLVGPSTKDPRGGWHRVTSAGAEVLNDPSAVAKVWAADRLAGNLHPALSSARSNFALGDYETASFAAMKAVEVEVRWVAGLPNKLMHTVPVCEMLGALVGPGWGRCAGLEEGAVVAEVRKQVRLPGRPRQVVHKVRVTDDQEQRLAAIAAEQGVTVSRLLVDSALSGGADVAAVKAALVGELYGVQRLLGRVGVNINQIAKVTNATGEWQAATGAALEAVGRVCVRLEEFLVDLDRGQR